MAWLRAQWARDGEQPPSSDPHTVPDAPVVLPHTTGTQLLGCVETLIPDPLSLLQS